MKELKRPKEPLLRYLIEGREWPQCESCGSSIQYEHEWLMFRWGKDLGCIHPECDNYYLRNKK